MSKATQNHRAYILRKRGIAHLGIAQIPDDVASLHSIPLNADQEQRASAAIAEACQALRTLRPVKPEPPVEVRQFNTDLRFKMGRVYVA